MASPNPSAMENPDQKFLTQQPIKEDNLEREFHLATKRGRKAWIVLILALISLPTSAVLAAKDKALAVDPTSTFGSTHTEQNIPHWAEPLDPNFTKWDNAPVTYTPEHGAVTKGRFPDCKTCPPDETNALKIFDYKFEPIWPDSPTVKIIAHWPAAGETTECTGILVDETSALTAGHCVFSHKTEHCDAEAPCWVDSLEIIAYQDSIGYESGYTELLTWTAWTENRDYDYDLAGIKLQEPLGNTVGWLGFGYHNDLQSNFFPEKQFEHSSYSGGSFLKWEGKFTTIMDHLFYSEDTSQNGQSGAGSHRNEYDHIVYSFLSHHRSFEDETHTGHTRMTPDKFFALRDWINGNMKDLNFESFLPIILN